MTTFAKFIAALIVTEQGHASIAVTSGKLALDSPNPLRLGIAPVQWVIVQNPALAPDGTPNVWAVYVGGEGAQEYELLPGASTEEIVVKNLREVVIRREPITFGWALGMGVDLIDG